MHPTHFSILPKNPAYRKSRTILIPPSRQPHQCTCTTDFNSPSNRLCIPDPVAPTFTDYFLYLNCSCMAANIYTYTRSSSSTQGTAGNNSIRPIWHFTKNSPTPSAPPISPSIWNSGCVSKRFGYPPAPPFQGLSKTRFNWSKWYPSLKRAEMLIFQPKQYPVAPSRHYISDWPSSFDNSGVRSPLISFPGYTAHRFNTCRCFLLVSSRSRPIPATVRIFKSGSMRSPFASKWLLSSASGLSTCPAAATLQNRSPIS